MAVPKIGGGSLYAIRCENESGLTLSSEMEVEAWTAIVTLVGFLNRGTEAKDLFLWKDRKSHLANARETYAWRGVIDSIKESDLARIGVEIDAERKVGGSPPLPAPLIRSKPIMLRMAGEITNALIHSYNNRHSITFFSI